ncbi:porin family protein [Vibrio barjaei]|uniref:Porin family protein n=1 Tax=Vibrio barjaei TaxID=1676683 RepID=A0ABW7IQD2_9VIBR
MKKLFLATAIAATSTGAFANADFSGHRVGIGASNLKFAYSGASWDIGTGVKVEYGYDFNQIFGINASYTWNQNTFDEHLDYKARTLKVDTDIGYAFDVGQAWVKPYGVVGLAFVSDEANTTDLGKLTGNDTSVYLGVGVRAQLDMGLYADLRYDLPTFDVLEADYLSFTVGYKF